MSEVISSGADSWVNNDKSEVGGMTDILFDKDRSEVMGRFIYICSELDIGMSEVNGTPWEPE